MRRRSAETRLALDLDLQDLLERQMTQYLATRAPDGFKNACALLIDYRTMEVRAAVGSADFRNAGHPRPGRRPAGATLAGVGAEAVHLRAGDG